MYILHSISLECGEEGLRKVLDYVGCKYIEILQCTRKCYWLPNVRFCRLHQSCRCGDLTVLTAEKSCLLKTTAAEGGRSAGRLAGQELGLENRSKRKRISLFSIHLLVAQQIRGGTHTIARDIKDSLYKKDF